MQRIFGPVILAAVLLSAVVPVASAQPTDQCPVGQSPHYVSGFAELQKRLGDWMGAALTCEFPDPNATGDVHQRTSKGLAFWRKSTNTPTFTNGSEHWALSPRGFVYWQGSSIDPPPTAIAATPNAANAVAPAAPAAPVAASPAPSAPPPSPSYVLPVVEAPLDKSLFTCVKRNPSCGRDAWWIEWNELQEDNLVQYRFLKPRFVTEARFIEAVWMLWAWPEGQQLLLDAADSGVMVVTSSSPDTGIFAAYIPSLTGIQMNRRFVEGSTWMIADVLAHELKHASDDKLGLFQTQTSSDCITREQRAYSVEQRFLRWVSNRFGGLPAESSVALRLTLQDFQLFENLREIAYSPDVNAQALDDYLGHC